MRPDLGEGGAWASAVWLTWVWPPVPPAPLGGVGGPEGGFNCNGVWPEECDKTERAAMMGKGAELGEEGSADGRGGQDGWLVLRGGVVAGAG